MKNKGTSPWRILHGGKFLKFRIHIDKGTESVATITRRQSYGFRGWWMAGLWAGVEMGNLFLISEQHCDGATTFCANQIQYPNWDG